MISKHEIGSAQDAARYHDRAFAVDGALPPSDRRDNYYVDEQAAAVWQGRGAEILGLEGQPVTRAQFVAFLEGKMPLPGTDQIQDLADNSRGASRRAGFDLTVAPPKSVSLVGLIGGDERVVAAHLAANRRAMTWLQEHGAVVRIRHGSEVHAQQRDNLLYATVLHETNRDNEPQLHSHNVVIAAVFDDEAGKWRSLTNDQIYRLRASADVVYKAELAKHLVEAGYQLDRKANGVDFEIAGVGPEHLEAFSSRSAAIKDALRARGVDPTDASYQARQTAALDTRAHKVELGRETLDGIWADVSRQQGIDLVGLVERAREAAQANVRQDFGARQAGEVFSAVSWAVEHLSEREQAFSRPALETEALRFGAAYAAVDDVQAAIAAHVNGGRLIQRSTTDVVGPWYTTVEALNNETTLIANIVAGKGRGNAVVENERQFTEAVAAFEARKSQETGQEWKLSAEQVVAARNVLLHGDDIQGIQGEAGTGKTAALELVREVAESRGWNVMGVATGGAAASELERASGIPSQTIAAFFVERNRALEEAQRRASELQRSLAAADGSTRLVEQRVLHALTRDQDFGAQTYIFDHRSADVWRARSTFGLYLSQMARSIGRRLDEHRDRALLERAAGVAVGRSSVAVPGPTVEDRLLSLVAGVATSLGERLGQLDEVGVVEANAARKALLEADPSERGRLVHDLLVQLAVIDNLKRTGNVEGRKTLLVMDESSMTGAADAARISEFGRSIGARLVFQGDIKQHGSVPAGRAFAQAQRAGMNTARLTETRRFDRATPQVKAAVLALQQGAFANAIGMLDALQVDDDQLAATVAKRYVENLAELRAKGVETPTVGVVTVTNRDRQDVNSAIHDALLRAGDLLGPTVTKEHLDDPKLTQAQRMYASTMAAAGVDRLIFRKAYRELGVLQGDVLRVVGFDTDANRVHAVRTDGTPVVINPQRQDAFSAAIAGTREYAVGEKVELRSAIQAGEGRTRRRLANGARAVVRQIDTDGATLALADGTDVRLDNAQLRKVDYAYAHTSFREQGATNDLEIVALSRIGASVFNKESAYVALTRARDNTEIVAVDFLKAAESAGRQVAKTVAVPAREIDREVSQMSASLAGGRVPASAAIEALEAAPGRSISGGLDYPLVP